MPGPRRWVPTPSRLHLVQKSGRPRRRMETKYGQAPAREEDRFTTRPGIIPAKLFYSPVRLALICGQRDHQGGRLPIEAVRGCHRRRQEVISGRSLHHVFLRPRYKVLARENVEQARQRAVPTDAPRDRAREAIERRRRPVAESR